MSVVSLATLVCLTVAGSYATPIVRSDDAVKYVGYKLYRADVFPGKRKKSEKNNIFKAAQFVNFFSSKIV